MNLKRIIIFLSVFSLLLISGELKAHPFYISLCQVNYNEEDHLLEFAIKIFAEDLEKELHDQGIEPLFLGEKIENLNSDSIIFTYINSKVKVDLNGQKASFKYVGKEIEDDAIWCYVEIQDVNTIHSLSVRNQILLDTHSDQKNIVQFTMNNHTNNFLFNKNKTFDYLIKEE